MRITSILYFIEISLFEYYKRECLDKNHSTHKLEGLLPTLFILKEYFRAESNIRSLIIHISKIMKMKIILMQMKNSMMKIENIQKVKNMKMKIEKTYCLILMREI